MIKALLRFLFGAPVAPAPDPNIEYRRHEKEKALRAMSVTQRTKAAELNEGAVADLEWNGTVPIIIMAETTNVYEWDGFDWVDRHPRSNYSIKVDGSMPS